MNTKKTLVVVDVQRDFFDPAGSLYVKGGELLPAKIAAIAPQYDNIVFTLDWHPGNHCSFKARGGQWPSHCVQFTQGAGLADEFSEILAQDNVHLVVKGCDPAKEQYGAFEAVDDQLEKIFTGSTHIDICGIAGDYCVKETAADLLEIVPATKITMLQNLICSIDDGSALKAFIRESGCN